MSMHDYRRGQPPAVRRGVAAVVATLLIVAALRPAAVAAQSEQALDWSNVMRLRVGDDVLVKLDSGEFSGTVDEVGPDSLSVTTKARGPMVFPRPVVKTIRNGGRLSKKGMALIGGGILVVGTVQLINAGRDLNALSAGRFPEDHGVRWEVVGFGVAGVGAWMLVAGGGKTIYKRLTD